MRNWWKSLPLRGALRDRGETPIAVMLGLTVLALLALAAGPALLSMTAQSAANSNDRRADKALAVLVDTTRRDAWQSLDVGGPYTDTVTLAGEPTTVTTWVEQDPAHHTRRIVTKAIAEHLSGANCAVSKPAAAPTACIVRSAVVSATAIDERPALSPNVTLANPAWAQSTLTRVPAAQNIFQVAVSGPMRVSVIARASADVNMHLVANDIVRAQVALKPSEAGSEWRFGNAIICPSWAKSTATARLAAPANVEIADLLVLTTPAPGACS